jgi:hypothetical protein
MVFYLKQTWLRWLDQNIIRNIASAYETNTILQCFTLQLRGKVSRRFTVLFYINFRLLSIENHITINHILDLKTNDSLVKKLSSLIFSHNINFYILHQLRKECLLYGCISGYSYYITKKIRHQSRINMQQNTNSR